MAKQLPPGMRADQIVISCNALRISVTPSISSIFMQSGPTLPRRCPGDRIPLKHEIRTVSNMSET
jgi:hypothetical protein